MSKRKLSREQAWRIKKIQSERAERAAKRSDQLDRQLEEGELGPEQHGLVISHFGQQVDIEALEGDQAGSIHRCHLRANLEALVTGDRVVWRTGKSGSVVVAHLPRSSLLSRPDSFGNIKPVAANIDHIVVVIAPQPTPHANLIDRYLVAAETVGIKPVILLNKTDLLDEENQREIDDLLSIYPELGYQVLQASTKKQHGLDHLKSELKNRVAVFVGQSGVGKSSLINTLLPGVDLKVGELSHAAAKGRHTTTTARLFHFPEGGELIDSPGIREFGLWHMDRETVACGFVEIRPHLGHCRFRDCSHQGEPGCALQQAVEDGAVSERRMLSFESIAASLEQL